MRIPVTTTILIAFVASSWARPSPATPTAESSDASSVESATPTSDSQPSQETTVPDVGSNLPPNSTLPAGGNSTLPANPSAANNISTTDDGYACTSDGKGFTRNGYTFVCALGTICKTVDQGSPCVASQNTPTSAPVADEGDCGDDPTLLDANSTNGAPTPEKTSAPVDSSGGDVDEECPE